MGLSSKQVSIDMLDWNKDLSQAQQNLELPKRPSMKRQHQQQNHQTSEPLKCPRCDSTNTKFCYFNNYNESQPRHFCKACKRHWTKGGTLRNVPVGGGRKNKKIKRTTASPSVTSAAITNANNKTTTITTPATNSIDPHETIHASQQRQNLPLEPVGRKNLAGVLYQPMNDQISLLPQHNHLIDTCGFDSKYFVGTKGSGLMGPPQTHSQCLQVPFSSSSCFDTNLSSITTSFQSSNVYDHGDELIRTIDQGSTMNGIMSGTSGTYAPPWPAPVLGSGLELSNTWNWEDIDSLVSTDLNVPWEGSDIKPSRN